MWQRRRSQISLPKSAAVLAKSHADAIAERAEASTHAARENGTEAVKVAIENAELEVKNGANDSNSSASRLRRIIWFRNKR
jgi:hypothetical protein